MEVTKNNFQELLPEIEQAIKKSTFVCVDGEFTGLTNVSSISALDTPAEYYEKVRTGAMDFLFVQFGLAAFQYNESSKRYTTKVYNFYIFPRPLNRSAPDQRFLCQSSSIDFLASNGLDFNKLFKEGIPFLTRSDEEKLRETMAERRRYHAANADNPVPVPQQFQPQVEAACNKIGKLLEDSSDKDEITLDKCSAFVRKLIYQTARERFGDERLQLDTVEGGSIRVKKGKGQTKEEREEEFRAKDEADIDTAIGFSKVIRTIAASEKLVVGHNMLLDICHMVHRFCDPLPDEYQEFKEMIHCLFPKLVDTKFLCNNSSLKEILKSSILEHIAQAIQEEPFVKQDIDGADKFNYGEKFQKYHEAGYDAYVTGKCFLSLLSYLQSEDGESCEIEKSKTLETYLNKLFLMRTPDTYINLVGEDVEPSRDHVFFLKFPKTWTSQNIYDLFNPYGNVQISWLDDTSAWVSLFNKKESERVRKNLVGRKKGGVIISPYSARKRPSSNQPHSAREGFNKRAKRESRMNNEAEKGFYMKRVLEYFLWLCSCIYFYDFLIAGELNGFSFSSAFLFIHFFVLILAFHPELFQ